jgi:hypothetical protein
MEKTETYQKEQKLSVSYCIGRVIIYVLLIFMAAIMLVPFAWMISASLKVEKDVFSFPIVWIPKNPQWSNYITIWKKIPLLIGFLNSAKLTIFTTVLQLLTSSFAAYAFAKLKFKGRDTIFHGVRHDHSHSLAGIYGSAVYHDDTVQTYGQPPGNYSHACIHRFRRFHDETVFHGNPERTA